MKKLLRTFHSITSAFALYLQVVWIDLQLFWNRAQRIWYSL